MINENEIKFLEIECNFEPDRFLLTISKENVISSKFEPAAYGMNLLFLLRKITPNK